MATKVLVRAPDVARAPGYGNAPANGVAAGRFKGPGGRFRGTYGPTETITCDGKPGYALSIKDGSVVLETTDSSNLNQKWDKDESWGDGFAIVNEATGQAIQRPPEGAGHRLLLVTYSTTKRDNSVMWRQDNPKSCPIREHDDANLVFDIMQRGPDTLAIVSNVSTASTQKWTMTESST
ncbi:hypothetical protein ACP4OV_013152 [Aristida adscensionis]